MAGKKSGGIRSAFDLAMERLDRSAGKSVRLSDAQKAALAEVTRKAQADVAEIEITMQRRIQEMRVAGDLDKAKELEEQQAADIRRIRARAEEEKEAIRRGAAES